MCILFGLPFTVYESNHMGRIYISCNFTQGNSRFSKALLCSRSSTLKPVTPDEFLSEQVSNYHRPIKTIQVFHNKSPQSKHQNQGFSSCAHAMNNNRYIPRSETLAVYAIKICI